MLAGAPPVTLRWCGWSVRVAATPASDLKVQPTAKCVEDRRDEARHTGTEREGGGGRRIHTLIHTYIHRHRYRHRHRSVIMPSAGVTGHRDRVGGSHPAAVPWVPGLPETVHSLNTHIHTHIHVVGEARPVLVRRQVVARMLRQ